MKAATRTQSSGREVPHPAACRRAGAIVGAALLALTLTPGTASGGTVALFGPEELSHPGGRRTFITRSFDAAHPGSGYTLELRAGGDATERPPTWAIVVLNGERVVASHLKRKRPARIERSVTLGSENRLEVYLGGRSGSVSLAVLGEDGFEIQLEFLDPRPGSVQYNSGWPISLRLTLPRNSSGGPTRIGVDSYDQERTRDRAGFNPFPEDHNTAALPRDGQAAVAVFEDIDGCFSFIGYDAFVTLSEGFLFNDCHPGKADPLIGEIHACSEPVPQCSSGVSLPCDGLREPDSDRRLRCPDETGLRFRPGNGVGRSGLPALVLLSDTGPGHRAQCCEPLDPDDGSCGDAPPACDTSRLPEADNIADWDAIGYQRLDHRGETTISAHMIVPFGLLAPVVELDESIGDSSACGSSVGGPGGGQFCYRVDGGPLCPDFCTGYCGIDAIDQSEFQSIPGERRMDDLYIPIFNAKPVTLRAFVVDLENTFDEAGIATLWDANGDGVVDARDAVEEGYELLSNEAVVTVRQRYSTTSVGLEPLYEFAGTCDEELEHGLALSRYAGLQLFRYRDLDGRNGFVNLDPCFGGLGASGLPGCELWDSCFGNSSGPGGTSPPPD